MRHTKESVAEREAANAQHAVEEARRAVEEARAMRDVEAQAEVRK